MQYSCNLGRSALSGGEEVELSLEEVKKLAHPLYKADVAYFYHISHRWTQWANLIPSIKITTNIAQLPPHQ